MRFTSEQRFDGGVLEREFTLGEVPGVLWTHGSAPAPLILIGHNGGLHKREPRLVARALHSAAEYGARATSRGSRLCKPPLWPIRISGAGADPGVHRTPGTSPRVNSRSRTPSSRRCSEVNRMVVPFGSALERRSRTTYRPTVTPEESTLVDTFTGTTSSFSRTAFRNVAVVAVVHQQVSRGSVAGRHGATRQMAGFRLRRSSSASKMQRIH